MIAALAQLTHLRKRLWPGCKCILFACLVCCKQLQLCASLIVSYLSHTRLIDSEVCSLSLNCAGRTLSYVSAVFQKPYWTINGR